MSRPARPLNQQLIDRTMRDRSPVFASDQTHCKNGHAFTPENTQVRRASGWRGCRICIRDAARRNHGIRLYAQRGRWVHSPSEIKELAALERGEGIKW